jgi:hypothetical protein
MRRAELCRIGSTLPATTTAEEVLRESDHRGWMFVRRGAVSHSGRTAHQRDLSVPQLPKGLRSRDCAVDTPQLGEFLVHHGPAGQFQLVAVGDANLLRTLRHSVDILENELCANDRRDDVQPRRPRGLSAGRACLDESQTELDHACGRSALLRGGATIGVKETPLPVARAQVATLLFRNQYVNRRGVQAQIGVEIGPPQSSPTHLLNWVFAPPSGGAVRRRSGVKV